MTFFRDENGQGMVEYALIIGLIAVAVILAVAFVGRTINNQFFETVGSELDSAGNG
ncbi:MAG: Flp family type IVb pilin [Eubacterium sp.]|nr:Flp family type IVb pilin [Eubacterium sp.]